MRDTVNSISTPETIRILLFKECRLKARQLIFDSHLSRYGNSKEIDSSKSEKKNADEFSHLTEMIFGSTAMKYQDTYYKIHDTSSPDRLIFTQVFSTPKIRKFQGNSDDNFSQSNSSILGYDSSTNSLSQSSLGSRSDSFSIFRKNNWVSANSTTSTIDSGFFESSFASNSSFQPSYGSFIRSDRLQPSKTSLSFYNSFVDNPEASAGRMQNVNYSRLGLALILPVAADKQGYKNMYIQHITFIESILWRIRQYMELALNSPRFFLANMLEITSITAKWLSELKFWSKNNSDNNGTKRSEGITITLKKKLSMWKSLLFRSEPKDKQFDSFCRTLSEFDVKETKFFLSAILTSVLTHHTGWVASCYPVELSLNDSYHAVWRQLTNLYGTSGHFTKTSKTVIYGVKDNEVIKEVINFLQYFIRYFKVQRRFVERNNILEENINIDDICERSNQIDLDMFKPPVMKKLLTKSKKIGINLDEMANVSETKNISPIYPDSSNSKAKKGLGKVKTFEHGLNMICDLDNDNEFDHQEENTNKPLFILGDDEKLQNLKKMTVEYENRYTQIETKSVGKEESEKSVKLKIIKFPLPKVKCLDDTSEIIPYEFLPEIEDSGHYVPDKIIQATNIPEQKWKNTLKNDIFALRKSCLFANQIEENVAILGNTDTWEVQVWSSTRNRLKRNELDSSVDSSSLVSNMLEVVLQMWKSNLSKEQCSTFMEQRLVEICLKANALSQFLLSTDFCTMENLLTSLKLNTVDIPLLMSVGANINPEVLKKYGISYQ